MEEDYVSKTKDSKKQYIGLDDYISEPRKYSQREVGKPLYPTGEEFVNATEAQKGEIPDLASRLKKRITEEL